MSQTRSGYGCATAVALEAFRDRPCSLPKTHPDYLPPTTQEVKSLRNLLGFPQAMLGDFWGKSYHLKDCKAARHWETTIESKEHNPIDHCALQLMLLAAGVISIDERIASSFGYKGLLNSRDEPKG